MQHSCAVGTPWVLGWGKAGMLGQLANSSMIDEALQAPGCCLTSFSPPPLETGQAIGQKGPLQNLIRAYFPVLA